MTTEPPSTHLIVRFAVEGDLRFLSHRDTVRLWQRACIRAQTPVAWTRGFNPKPRLRLPLPRAVGMAAARERLDLRLEEPIAPEELARRLRPHLPAGLNLGEIHLVKDLEDALCHRARYRLTLAPDAALARIADRIADFQAADSWPIVRPRRGRHPQRTVDLRAAVETIALRDNAVELTIRTGDQVTPRIEEIRHALGLADTTTIQEVRRLDAEFGSSSAMYANDLEDAK